MRLFIHVFFIIIIFFLVSCSTKKVKNEQYLLKSNKFTYLDNKNKPYESDLSDYVIQKTNKTILAVIPFSLWIYDFSKPKFDSVYIEYYSHSEKERRQSLLDSLYIKYNLAKSVGHSRWLDRFFFKNGEPPVIVEENMSEKSSRNLEKYFQKRGWLHASVKDTLIKKSKKKASVDYQITLGPRMMIDKIVYDIPDLIMEKNYNDYLSSSYFKYTVKKGFRLKPLNAVIMEKDIENMEFFMKNRGFYDFNISGQEILYYVDTTSVKVDSIVNKKEIRKIVKVPLRVQIKKDKNNLIDSTDVEFKPFKYKKIAIFLGNDFSDIYGLQSAYSFKAIDSIFNADSKKWSKENQRVRKTRRMLNGEQKIVDTISIDKIVYEDNYYIVNNRKDFKNKVLKDMLVIEQDSLYRLLKEDNTRRNISKLNNFNIVDFSTGKLTDSTLISRVFLYPKKKYDLEISFEGFASQKVKFGVSPQINYTIKNLLKGGENLTLSASGTLGNIESKKQNNRLFNSYEIGFQAGLTFPRWILPFKTERLIPKRFVPTSSVNFGISQQHNIGLDRRSFLASLDYKMSPTIKINHKLTLWNLQYTQYLNSDNYFNMYTTDKKYRDEMYNEYTDYLQNNPSSSTSQQLAEWNELSDNKKAYLIMSNNAFINMIKASNSDLFNNYNLVQLRQIRFTQDFLISSIIYSFIYDEQQDKNINNPFYFSGGIEFAGNVLSLFNKSLPVVDGANAQVSHTIFKVPYSQFAKIDLDMRKFFNFDNGRKTLAARLFLGIGIPYGNSITMPFNRLYSVGGANDVRAWKAYGFGPATSDLGKKDGFELAALDNMKLLASIEYRFLLNRELEGAFFIDAGNVWSTNKSDNTLEDDRFKFNEFYKQLGIGGGFGIRYTVGNYFTLRFDFAYKFHNPTIQKASHRWVIDKIQILKPQIQFAIGYPF